MTTAPVSSSEPEPLARFLREHGSWYLFLAPALILLVVFLAFPLYRSLELAFFKWNGLGARRWVGLSNFLALFNDRLFWGALSHTFIISIATTAGTVGLGLVLAIAISRRMPFTPLYRFAFYLPVMLPLTVVAALWTRMLETTYGVVNTLLRAVGLGAFALTWLADTHTALWSVIVVVVWQYAGFPMIVLLAAIEGVPQTLHEAAQLDGANAWHQVRHITLPLIRPVIISISVIQIIFSLKIFDVIWVMTKGGPAESTSVLGTYLYKEAFELHDYGFASAIAVTMFSIIFTITYLYNRLMSVEHVEF